MNISKLKIQIKLSLNLILKLTNTFLRFFDYKVDIVPYSGKLISILILYKLSNRRQLNYLGDTLICKSKFFDYEIFHQSNDMRAIFPNEWQVDSVSIAILSKASKIFDEKDFYDFGANYGMFSLPYLNDKTIKSHIIVEANPFLITCLKKTFNKNQKIVNKALVGEKEYKSEKVNINIIPCGSGASSIDKEITSINPFLNYALDIDSTTPSILFKKYSKSKKALLKIDIEQQELN